ncbi:hypothetical protein ACQ4PT_029790 [Festuca glaucescens]
MPPVPNKVRIFSWRLASDNLPTQKNNWRRTLELQNICTICGNGVQDSFHATVACSKAKALRHRMKDFWPMPKEDKFVNSGTNWLLILLDSTPKNMHRFILLTLWRSWHLRDDAIHAKGDATIDQSVRFLLSYVNTLDSDLDVDDGPGPTDGKGKTPDQSNMTGNSKQIIPKKQSMVRWEPPPVNWLKINVDGSFVPATGSASVGVVIRDHCGYAIAGAWRVLENFTSAEEAEADEVVPSAMSKVMDLGFGKGDA